MNIHVRTISVDEHRFSKRDLFGEPDFYEASVYVSFEPRGYSRTIIGYDVTRRGAIEQAIETAKRIGLLEEGWSASEGAPES